MAPPRYINTTSYIKNWQKIYFIDFNQKLDIHKNIINQIINDYETDTIDFHVAYVPHENGDDHEQDLFQIHSYLKEKLENLKKFEKFENLKKFENLTNSEKFDKIEKFEKFELEMSIVYNQHTDYHTKSTMAIWEDISKKNPVKIQQYSRSWGDNEIQLENRRVRLGNDGKYIDINPDDEDGASAYKFRSINMFPKSKDSFGGLRAFLSSVAGENKWKNKENRNGGVYYKFNYKFKEEYPTIQWNEVYSFYEHADVPYNKFKITLGVNGTKSEEEYEFPISRTFEKGVRTVGAIARKIKNVVIPTGGKTRKHRKRKMRSSKRKANKKGRKSRKKKSSSRKKK